MGATQSWEYALPDGCPPTEAKQAHGTFFRLVSSRPPGSHPKANDFRVSRSLLQSEPPQTPAECSARCKRLGLSFDSSLENLYKFRAGPATYTPEGRSSKVPAKGTLEEEDGVMVWDGTPSPTHHNLWIRKDRAEEIAKRFRVVPPPSDSASPASDQE